MCSTFAQLVRISAWLLMIGTTAPSVALAQTRATGFLDRTVTAGAGSYRYQVYVPYEHTPDRQWPVMLWLHGGAPRGDDGLRPTNSDLAAAIRQNRERFPAIVVFPQVRAGHRWDNGMKAQAVAALEASAREFRGDNDRTYLVGYSMRGRGTWTLAWQQPDRFAALVVIAGPVVDIPQDWTSEERETALREIDFLRAADPYAALASKIRSIPIRLFHGSADTLARPEESRLMERALRQLNADVRLTEYPGLGHDSARALADAELWSWLLAQPRPNVRSN